MHVLYNSLWLKNEVRLIPHRRMSNETLGLISMVILSESELYRTFIASLYPKMKCC